MTTDDGALTETAEWKAAVNEIWKESANEWDSAEIALEAAICILRPLIEREHLARLVAEMKETITEDSEAFNAFYEALPDDVRADLFSDPEMLAHILIANDAALAPLLAQLQAVEKERDEAKRSGAIWLHMLWKRNDEIDTLKARVEELMENITATEHCLTEAERQRDAAIEALRKLEPYLDAIVCYASTMNEHEPNQIVHDIRQMLAQSGDPK